MARPGIIAGANVTLHPPEGMEESCVPMAVWRGEGLVVSRWDLSAGEAAEVARTRAVYFSAIGQTHPPVFLASRPEMEEFVSGCGQTLPPSPRGDTPLTLEQQLFALESIVAAIGPANARQPVATVLGRALVAVLGSSDILEEAAAAWIANLGADILKAYREERQILANREAL